MSMGEPGRYLKRPHDNQCESCGVPDHRHVCPASFAAETAARQQAERERDEARQEVTEGCEALADMDVTLAAEAALALVTESRDGWMAQAEREHSLVGALTDDATALRAQVEALEGALNKVRAVYGGANTGWTLARYHEELGAALAARTEGKG